MDLKKFVVSCILLATPLFGEVQIAYDDGVVDGFRYFTGDC